MKTAVEAIFVGKARRYNRRFLQMCSHHLIEPVACTPASGWGLPHSLWVSVDIWNGFVSVVVDR